MNRVKEAVATNYFLGEIVLSRRLIYMLAFNLLLIASSYIQIPLPFSPVPVTAQTMAVLACGLFLGPVGGALTVLAYLIEGSLGLPVFAGGSAGFAKLIGPTGGYLLGFVLAAWIVGKFSEKSRSLTYGRLILALTLGTAAIFVCGLAVLSVFIPREMLLQLGLYPFIPGAVIKVLVVASALAACKSVQRKL